MLNLAHKELEVYQIAMKLVKEVYHATSKFPAEERYVLTTQLRRAAVSVCSNIAEGASRRSKIERARFYEISRSCSVEIDTQIEISILLEYLQANDIKQLEGYLESVFKMLTRMINTTNPK